MKKHWKSLIVAVALPLALGGLSAWISGGMDSFEALNKPPLSPPGWVFPAVWSVLYLMMGVASWRVYVLKRPAQERREALNLYAVQLIVNVLWPVVFFRFELYWAAAVWLAVLVVLVALTLSRFKRLDDLAGLLLWPYLIWCLFALYLNLGVAILN